MATKKKNREKPVGIRDLRAAAKRLWPNDKATVQVFRSAPGSVHWSVEVWVWTTPVTQEGVTTLRASRAAALRSALAALLER